MTLPIRLATRSMHPATPPVASRPADRPADCSADPVVRRPGARVARRLLAAAWLLVACAAGPAQAQSGGISAVWAQEGGDKVLQHELRAAAGDVRNSVWDGTTISLFGARNEVVNFALVIESARGAQNVSVSFNRLGGPGNTAITSPVSPVRGDAVFNWTTRNIELFVVRYLQIRGLSKLSYDFYDERHVPSKMRRPGWNALGQASGAWQDRPGADKYFPEIAVPHELVPTFPIAAGQNQTVWCDIYIPLAARPGTYAGTLTVREGGRVARTIPVSLRVRDFALPQEPTAKTMVYTGTPFVAERYTGVRWPEPTTTEGRQLAPLMQRHWQMLHRHRLTPIVEEPTQPGQPAAASIERLNGSLYTLARGYDGPGRNVGDDLYAIGIYGHWDWKDGDQALYNARSDAWETWFRRNAPNVERFLYLVDEPNLRDAATGAQVNGWLDKLKANPGPGQSLRTFITVATPTVVQYAPRIDIAANWYAVADTGVYDAAVNRLLGGGPQKAQYQYNGKRPASGSFAIEDDGTSPRMLPWAQWKKGVARWFFWESTYYYDFQTKGQQVNVWQNANTYGKDESFDPSIGRTGFNYSNGDGVLFYPGTDKLFPDASLGVAGPVASLRLKFWRRGVQDADYIALAYAADPARTRAIVNRMVPKVLWEVGVQEANDPTWKRTDISWSSDPDAWEAARAELADVIENASKPRTPATRVQ